MVLQVHNDVSYLLANKALIIVGGYPHLSNDSEDPQVNGIIKNVLKIMTNVMESAAEVGGPARI